MASNADVVRGGFEALAEGGVEALLPLIHPEFEAAAPPELASEPDTYRGPEGIRRYFDSFYEAMDEIRFEPHEFREVGAKVVVPFTLRARGRTSGIEVEQSAVQVWELRDGKAYRLDICVTVEEALAAADAPDP